MTRLGSNPSECWCNLHETFFSGTHGEWKQRAIQLTHPCSPPKKQILKYIQWLSNVLSFRNMVIDKDRTKQAATGWRRYFVFSSVFWYCWLANRKAIHPIKELAVFRIVGRRKLGGSKQLTCVHRETSLNGGGGGGDGIFIYVFLDVAVYTSRAGNDVRPSGRHTAQSRASANWCQQAASDIHSGRHSFTASSLVLRSRYSFDETRANFLALTSCAWWILQYELKFRKIEICFDANWHFLFH